MDISVQNRKQWVVLTVRGRIDSYTYEYLDDKINLLQRMGKKNIALDLRGVSFVNINGARLIAITAREVRSEGGHLALISPLERAVEAVNLFTESTSYEVHHTLDEFEWKHMLL